ncbi:hypothetical protein OAB57_01130 [Bacteriovoracaceae bacterium]|nr:hypothetical protein [Bacteriovoracaceae bacterium]
MKTTILNSISSVNSLIFGTILLIIFFTPVFGNVQNDGFWLKKYDSNTIETDDSSLNGITALRQRKHGKLYNNVLSQLVNKFNKRIGSPDECKDDVIAITKTENTTVNVEIDTEEPTIKTHSIQRPNKFTRGDENSFVEFNISAKELKKSELESIQKYKIAQNIINSEGKIEYLITDEKKLDGYRILIDSAIANSETLIKRLDEHIHLNGTDGTGIVLALPFDYRTVNEQMVDFYKEVPSLKSKANIFEQHYSANVSGLAISSEDHKKHAKLASMDWFIMDHKEDKIISLVSQLESASIRNATIVK